jgi:tight adherence protein B
VTASAPSRVATVVRAVAPSRWRTGSRRRLRRLAGVEVHPWRNRHERALALLDRRRRLTAFGAAALAGIATGGYAGIVAGLVAALYAAVAVGVVARRRRDAGERGAARIAMDGLAALTAEMRAGADPVIATGAVLPIIRASGASGARAADRIGAALRVAEITGAQLADLLDRLDDDLRSVARVQDLAFAQAAGAQATAWLLAALPAAGIALGYGMGADALHELLHTRIGAACAGLAILFQLAGLGWSQRLADSIKAAA